MAARPELIPKAPLLPPGANYRRHPRQIEIPTLDERRYWAASGQRGGPILEARWSDARRTEDLLYVGCAATSLLTRLHPRSHFMWGVLQTNQQRASAVRIAVWSIPTKYCASVEQWLTEQCAPLWSSARSATRKWTWRAPDLVAPAEEFHPALRRAERPLMSSQVSGVYAWIVGTDVRRIMIDRAETRRPRRDVAQARRARPYWRCGHCNDVTEGVATGRSRCARCGWARAASEREFESRLKEAVRDLPC
jgi:hypothetical protein